MKNRSPPRANANIINYYTQDNCDCSCHFPEEQINHQNQILCQNIHTIHSISPCHSYTPSPDRIRVSRNSNHQIQNLQKNMSSSCLCVCENICDCPCHCVTCVCCPCVKDRPAQNTDNYYKNLYTQIKSELELEKRRNDRMKYDKELHKNNLQNTEKENKNLLRENEQLKNKLAEALTRLEQEEEKNNRRDEELYNFKNDDLPKLQESYENLIKKIKEEKDKKINYLNNQLNTIAKENVSLKYQLKRKQDDERASLDKIIEDLNIEINELKNELENKDHLIEQLKNENEDLNSQFKNGNSKYNQEIRELKNQNQKLMQTISLNEGEIRKLKNEIDKMKKDKSLGEQAVFTLKSGNENRDNEINSLKKMLIEKDEEIESLTNELEKLKAEFNNLGISYNDAANQLENLAELEQKYSTLLNENNQLKKENEENKNLILQNTKLMNLLKQKLS